MRTPFAPYFSVATAKSFVVVAIDLSKVGTSVVDPTAGVPGARAGARFWTYAVRDSEVLIQGSVPPDAILWLRRTGEKAMTPDEGTRRLVFHAQPGAGSFLDMLRPYRGLRVEVLDEVLAALRASASRVSVENPARDLVSALWAISHLGRSWALEPGGMLQRNQLISDEDQSKLRAFLERFDYAVMTLLEGGPEDEAFADAGTRE